MLPRIYISVPNATGWIHKHVALTLLRLHAQTDCEVTIALPTHRPYVHNLHLCRKEFLDGPFDYWLTIDDDNPPRRNPLELVHLDLDVVGCPTPVWANHKPGVDRPWYWNAVDAVRDPHTSEIAWKPHEPCSGLQEVDAVGSGCLLIARRVMEALPAPFLREWNAEGIVTRGGDYMFCHRAKAAGFRIHAHFDYPCLHFNELELNETIHALK